VTALDARVPIVYVGPTLSAEETLSHLPGAVLRPSVKREDLYRDREAGAAVFVLLDGIFAHTLSLSPREVVDVARDGALIVGASSMGALRAAECWPAGVRGVGSIYRLFRSGHFDTDDEVAVAFDPDDPRRTCSVALVNVRYAMSRGRRLKKVSGETAERILTAARQLHFSERRWPTILKVAGASDDCDLRDFCVGQDLKRLDAIRALRATARLLEQSPALGEDRARRTEAPFERRVRYRRDALLGRSPAEARRDLCVWLFGSGRYQRFIWPIVAGRPEARVEALPEERPALVREGLAAILKEELREPRALADALWHELEFRDEIHAEYARMHAVRTLAAASRARGVTPSPTVIDRAHAFVAITHGAPGWKELQESVDDGLLYDAIPFEWVEASALDLAHAQAWRP
jgi:hypothetical protein